MRINRLALAADSALLLAISLIWMGVSTMTLPWNTWLPLIVFGALAVLVSNWDVNPNARIGLMLPITLAVFTLWALMDSLAAALFGTVVWALFIVRRVRFAQGYSDDDVQVGRLLWDLGYMCLTAIVTQSATARTWPLHSWIGASFVVVVLLRIGGMRTAQIERAKRRGVADVPSLFGPFAGVVVVIGLALMVFLAFPDVRWLVIIGVIGLCLIYWLFSSKQNLLTAAVLSGLLFLLLWFTNYLEKHAKHKPFANKPLGSSGFGKLKGQHQIAHHAHIPSFVWFIVILLAVLTFFYVMYKSAHRKTVEEVQSGAPVITRFKMPGFAHGAFHEGPGMVGLTMRWLNWETALGNHLGAGETVRAFLQRRLEAVNPSPDAGTNGIDETTLDELVTLYEAERYGMVQTPVDRVVQVEGRMRLLGIFAKRKRP